MSNATRAGVRIVLTVFFGLFSLPAIIFGLYLFSCWFRIQTTDVYYVEYPYLLAALVLISLGALTLFSVAYASWRRSFYGLLFAIPVVLGLGTMVYIPDGNPHVQRSMVADTNYLSSVGSFFRVWYEENHSFPANETEFQEALRRGPAAWQNRVQSPSRLSFYSRGGKRLTYEILVTTNASGPRVDNVSTRPGIIYYCVSNDRQQFWVTMTALHEDVARAARLKRAGGHPHGDLRIIKATGKDYPIRKR